MGFGVLLKCFGALGFRGSGGPRCCRIRNVGRFVVVEGSRLRRRVVWFGFEIWGFRAPDNLLSRLV